MVTDVAAQDQGAAPSIEDARHAMYRRQILAAAEGEFARSGYEQTKVASVAKAADLSLATVYKTFAGKSEIWDELHAVRMRELLDRVEREAPVGASHLARILAGVGSVAGYLADHPTYLDLNLWAGTGWAAGQRPSRGVQETVWSAGLRTMAAGIEQAVAHREIPVIDPGVGAALVITSLQVWLAGWVEGGRREPVDRLVEAMTERLRWTLAGPPG